ncbi:hepatic leukemia factor-like isoform X2 [Paramacrobiotus metropolitanus]|nr:hepatic leukemia factor-like isoform X2 [Paramacrobiotus metropolitanus]
MSRNFLTSMTNSSAYGPYATNYPSLYWPSQNDAATNYFEQYRVPTTTTATMANVTTSAGFAPPCKYTEPDSTQSASMEHTTKSGHTHPMPEPLPVPLPSFPTDHPSMAILTRPNTLKRKPTPVSDDRKDDHYWERRNRNNESAKKSRLARKQREEISALRVVMLETENQVLRSQLDNAHTELKKLRCLLSSS